MRQQILLHSKDLIHQVLSPVTSTSKALEVPATYNCPYCKNLVTQTYQGKACKECLLQDFARLRPLQDFVIGKRYLSSTYPRKY